MKLARLVCLSLTTPQERWKLFEINIGQYTIKSIQSNIVEKSGQQRLILVAEKNLKYQPKVTRDKLLVVPEQDRIELEEALQIIGNLVAISEFRGRTISSPTPCVVFIPENQKELDFLNSTTGIEYFANTNNDFKFSLQDIIMKEPLLDRQEGCEFLAVALSQESVVGQLHEYVRLFERAFALNSNKLVDALHVFLSKSDVVYHKDEIKKWIIELRDGSTHADRRNKLIYESDVIRVIVRVRQAAYDVLFNKSAWHDPTIVRRKTYQASMGLLEDNEPYTIVNNPSFEGITQIMDPFNSFPMDLGTVFKTFPQNLNWWFKKSGDDDGSVKSKFFPFHVMKKTERKTKYKRKKNNKRNNYKTTL